MIMGLLAIAMFVALFAVGDRFADGQIIMQGMGHDLRLHVMLVTAFVCGFIASYRQAG